MLEVINDHKACQLKESKVSRLQDIMVDDRCPILDIMPIRGGPLQDSVIRKMWEFKI